MSAAMPDAEAVRTLLDKQEIAELLTRYCRGVDRGDADLVAQAYHEGAVEDHGGTYLGPASEYVAMLRRVLPKAPRMTHSITNLLIEIDGETAIAECYMTTFSRRELGTESFDSLTLARAVDRLEKRDGRWGIVHRRIAWEWNHEMPMRESWGRGAIVPDASLLVRGMRKPDDVLYQMKGEA